jgi:hypothetical protein
MEGIGGCAHVVLASAKEVKHVLIEDGILSDKREQ